MDWLTVNHLLDDVWDRQLQPHLAVRNIKTTLHRATLLRFCRQELTLEQTVQTLDGALVVNNLQISPEQRAQALMIARNLLTVRFRAAQVDKKVDEVRQQMGGVRVCQGANCVRRNRSAYDRL